MKTLQLDSKTASKIYKTADEEVKTILEASFTRTELLGNIMDRVKDWKDCCAEKGIDTKNSLPFPYPDSPHQEAVNAFFQVTTIASVLNEGWTPNWGNTKEYKYYPYFDCSGGGFRFGDYFCLYSRSHVGGRLVYRTSELAEYAGRQFEELYKKFMQF